MLPWGVGARGKGAALSGWRDWALQGCVGSGTRDGQAGSSPGGSERAEGSGAERPGELGSSPGGQEQDTREGQSTPSPGGSENSGSVRHCANSDAHFLCRKCANGQEQDTRDGRSTPSPGGSGRAEGSGAIGRRSRPDSSELQGRSGRSHVSGSARFRTSVEAPFARRWKRAIPQNSNAPFRYFGRGRQNTLHSCQNNGIFDSCQNNGMER